MRQRHRAGEKVFVDYSGKKLQLVDPQTGELRPVELFVGVLGASGLIYAEASADQSLTSWVDCHRHMLEYFGGSPGVFVPDQLRSAVAAPCRYEPEVNRAYQALARHYGAVVIPARPRKPKDKAYASYCILFGELNGDKDRRLCTPPAGSLDEHDVSKGFIQAPVVVAVAVSP